VFAEGEHVRPEDLPEGLRRAPSTPALPVPAGDRSLPDILEDLERQLILAAYERAKGVKAETARLLGIKPSALYYKLEKYGIVKPGEKPEDPA
jgi:two-component system response regulator HydG